MYVSVNRASYGSDDGLSPIRYYLNQCWVIVKDFFSHIVTEAPAGSDMGLYFKG